MDEPIRPAARHVRRAQKLGADARCVRCGCDDLMALERQGEAILCYECARKAEGRPTVEGHHPLGRQLDPDSVVSVPGNVHRLLDDAKADWEQQLRRTVGDLPMRRLIALLRSHADYCAVMGPRFGAAAVELYRKTLGLNDSERPTGLDP